MLEEDLLNVYFGGKGMRATLVVGGEGDVTLEDDIYGECHGWWVEHESGQGNEVFFAVDFRVLGNNILQAMHTGQGIY